MSRVKPAVFIRAQIVCNKSQGVKTLPAPASPTAFTPSTIGRTEQAIVSTVFPIGINNHDLLPYLARESRRQIFHLIDRGKRHRVVELLHV